MVRRCERSVSRQQFHLLFSSPSVSAECHEKGLWALTTSPSRIAASCPYRRVSVGACSLLPTTNYIPTSGCGFGDIGFQTTSSPLSSCSVFRPNLSLHLVLTHCWTIILFHSCGTPPSTSNPITGVPPVPPVAVGFSLTTSTRMSPEVTV
jgi:hypothetical protein